MRQHVCVIGIGHDLAFPFLFGGAFIEVFLQHSTGWVFLRFLAETFIEAPLGLPPPNVEPDFPSFLEGLSSRQ